MSDTDVAEIDALLTGSAIGSPILKIRAPLLLQPPGKAWLDVAMMQKDLRLALDTARTHGYQHRDISVLLQLLGDVTEAPASHPDHTSATT